MGDIAEGARRIGRHTAIGRLDPDNAGESRRDADRAAAVGADMQRAHAERRRRRRAAARSARRLRQIPGIAGDARARAVGHALPAEFRRRRFAQQHGAVLEKPRHAWGVFLPGLIGRDGERAAQRRPALRQDEILDRARHAVDQSARFAAHPARLRSPRRLDGARLIDEAECIYGGVVLLDALERGAHGLDRRQRLGGVMGEKLARGQIGNLAVHDAFLRAKAFRSRGHHTASRPWAICRRLRRGRCRL